MMNELDFALMIPEFIVIAGALAVLVVDAMTHSEDGEDPRSVITMISFGATVAAAGWILFMLWGDGSPRVSFFHLFVVDSFSLYFKVVILVGAALSLLLSDAWLRNNRVPSGASQALVLIATSGMMYMVSAGDMVMLFMGLEIMSIPIYCLAGSQWWDKRSTEAAVKYLVLGSFGTALFLFGLAMLYAFQGIEGAEPSTRLDLLRMTLTEHQAALPLFATGGGFMLLAGLLFKISAAPLHMWTPDVYEGAPTPITAYMSVAVKATTAAVLIRLFGGGILERLSLDAVLWACAALTMIVGNVMAVTQSNVKRMLAYSSIAHGGYILVGILAGTAQAEAGVLYYVLAYTVANIAAFGVLVYLSREGREVTTFDDLRGTGTARPLLGVVMVISMLSLIGMPPFAGFFGKFAVFSSAIEQGWIALSILAMLTSAVSVAYYLRPIIAMFMQAPIGAAPEPPKGNGRLVFAIGISTVAVVVLGVLPDRYLEWAASSVLALGG
jgi:NADH-quinone oxidoreductase subunit N